MIRSTPHPPQGAAVDNTSFEMGLGDERLLTIRSDFKIEDALATASDYLTCARATAYESADNSTPEFRPLARAVVYQIENVQALVDACLGRLEGKTFSHTSSRLVR